MKTTVEISDELLTRAQEMAAREKTTLRRLVEDGLRRVLTERGLRSGFRLRKASFHGDGLHPDRGTGDWARVRERIYKGRGE